MDPLDEDTTQILSTLPKFSADYERLDIPGMIATSRRRTEREAWTHLPLQLGVLDSTLEYLLRLDELNEVQVEAGFATEGGVFPWHVSRMIALTSGTRTLILCGLEDAARPVVRSLLETRDLALLCLADPDFSSRYVGEDPEHNEAEFWHEEIARGRAAKKLREVLAKTALDDVTVEDFLTTRQEFLTLLSGAVHGSVSSAMRSYVVPSLVRPGYLTRAPLGHVSVHAPGLVSGVVRETLKFGAIVLHLVMGDRPPPLYEEIVDDQKRAAMLTSFLILQELVERHGTQLPPPFHFPEVPETEGS